MKKFFNPNTVIWHCKLGFPNIKKIYKAIKTTLFNFNFEDMNVEKSSVLKKQK